MTEDEREILLHSVVGLTLLMERLGQHDLADQYGQAIRAPVERVVALKKQQRADSAGGNDGTR